MLFSIDTDDLRSMGRKLGETLDQHELAHRRLGLALNEAGVELLRELGDGPDDLLVQETRRMTLGRAMTHQLLLVADATDNLDSTCAREFEALLPGLAVLQVSIDDLLTRRTRLRGLLSPGSAPQRNMRLGSVTPAGGVPLRAAEVPRVEPAPSPAAGVSEAVSSAVVPAAPSSTTLHGATVDVLAQSNSVSCGQTSVAMAVNSLTGKHLTDSDINGRYGFGLMDALNGESADSGYHWKDGGDLGPQSWQLIEHKVTSEHTPVIVALNGPDFSPSGRGHIVTIVRLEGEKVFIADPATGSIRCTTRMAMNSCPPHPDGKFIFFAERTSPA